MKLCITVQSTLRDLAFFVREVRTTSWAELLDFEFFGHRALVLGGRVVCTAALAARHFNQVTHGILLRLSSKTQSNPMLMPESGAIGAEPTHLA
jgi:hypothetical protein